MGKISTTSEKQKIILKEIADDPFLSSQFYFTGGTALAEIYLHHRTSEDLDFFSEKKYDSAIVSNTIKSWAKKLKFRYASRYVEPANIFLLNFPDRDKLKIDFNHYPYVHIKQFETYKGLKVDSKFDIAINKLLTITQRIEVKDFVDLYYLLQDFSFWDLKIGVERKFNVDIEPILIAADFLAVDEFKYLPKMLKPITLTKLQQFFRDQAKKLGLKSVR